MECLCKTVEETEQLGRKLGSVLRSGDIVSLRGSLGAGKTVIAKGVADALGITEPVVSPTFTLLQEYEGSLVLYHFDLYRLDGVEDFEMIGGDETIFSDGVSLIEWSEKIQELLPNTTIYVYIKINDDQSRTVKIEGYDIDERFSC